MKNWPHACLQCECVCRGRAKREGKTMGFMGEDWVKTMGFMSEDWVKTICFRGRLHKNHPFRLGFWGKTVRPLSSYIILTGERTRNAHISAPGTRELSLKRAF